MDASRCVEERADERVRNAEKHARLADERATQVIRAERQVTSHRLELQSRNVNRLSRKLADDYTLLNAKQKEDSDAATIKKKAYIDTASAAAASAAASAAANIILSLRFAKQTSQQERENREQLLRCKGEYELCLQQHELERTKSENEYMTRITNLEERLEHAADEIKVRVFVWYFLLLKYKSHDSPFFHTLMQNLKHQLPKLIQKVPREYGGREWDETTMQMIMECHSHRTPPESIQANIATLCSYISPNRDILKEMPSISFIRESRSALAVETLTLGAYQIAKASRIIANHSDGTRRRGISIDNNVIKIAEDSGYKNVCLSSFVICKDQTAEQVCAGTVRTFQDGAKLLEGWRRVASCMFPNDASLLEEIPMPSRLGLGRLAQDKVWVLTDGCPAATLFRKLFQQKIRAEAEQAGMTPEQISIYEMDCFHHLRCVWAGAVVVDLGTFMNEILDNDLNAIHSLLRVSTDIGSLCIAVEKFFGRQANYEKVWSSCSIFSYDLKNHPHRICLMFSCDRERAASLIGGLRKCTREITSGPSCVLVEDSGRMG